MASVALKSEISQELRRILPALRRLCIYYRESGEANLCKIIEASHVFVETHIMCDNEWGENPREVYDVFLFVPNHIISPINLNDEEKICAYIRKDLAKTTRDFRNEFVGAVHLKLADPLDPRVGKSVSYSQYPYHDPESAGPWKGSKYIRLFLSHRDEYKIQAQNLADTLDTYGICAFVAHDDIEPTKEWQQEIRKALGTMEVMLVLLTDDFHDSAWTDQEIGFAIARNIDIICLKVGAIDPKGFISGEQALQARLRYTSGVATKVYDIIKNIVGKERIKEVLIELFISSEKYIQAIDRLDKLKEEVDRLAETEFKRIVEAYSSNSQLHGCDVIHKNNGLKNYLEAATGKQLEIGNRKIKEINPTPDDIDEDAPF